MLIERIIVFNGKKDKLEIYWVSVVNLCDIFVRCFIFYCESSFINKFFSSWCDYMVF